MATDQPTSTNGPAPAEPVVAAPQRIVLEQPATYFGRFGKLLLIVLALAIIYILALHAQYRNYFNPAGGPQECLHVAWGIRKNKGEALFILDEGHQIVLEACYPPGVLPDTEDREKSWARVPDGSGEFVPGVPTPGAPNVAAP